MAGIRRVAARPGRERHRIAADVGGVITGYLWVGPTYHGVRMIDGLSTPGLLGRVRKRLVGPADPRVRYECRRCGRTMRPAHESCPDCGAHDVGRYEL